MRKPKFSNFYQEQIEMYNILSITVNATLGHSMSAKSVQQLVLIIRRSEQYFRV